MIEGKPGFLINPKCKTSRKGFLGKYQFRRLKTTNERYTDKPDKNMYSHIQDAIQYVATHLFASGLKTSKKSGINYRSIYGS
jgi:hypothetical protein